VKFGASLCRNHTSIFCLNSLLHVQNYKYDVYKNPFMSSDKCGPIKYGIGGIMYRNGGSLSCVTIDLYILWFLLGCDAVLFSKSLRTFQAVLLSPP
jgi:hypothetical protein